MSKNKNKQLLAEMQQQYVDYVRRYLKFQNTIFSDIFGDKSRIAVETDNSLMLNFIEICRSIINEFSEKKSDAAFTLELKYDVKVAKQKMRRLRTREEYISEREIPSYYLLLSEEIIIPSGPQAGEKRDKQTRFALGSFIQKSKMISQSNKEFWQKNQTKYHTLKIAEQIAGKNFAGMSVFEVVKHQMAHNEPWSNRMLQKITEPKVLIYTRNAIDILRKSDMDGIQSCHSQGDDYFYCAVTEALNQAFMAYEMSKEEFLEIENLQDDEIFGDSERDIPGPQPDTRIRVMTLKAHVVGADGQPMEIFLPVPETKKFGVDSVSIIDETSKFIISNAEVFQSDELFQGFFSALKNRKVSRLGGSYRDHAPEGLLRRLLSEYVDVLEERLTQESIAYANKVVQEVGNSYDGIRHDPKSHDLESSVKPDVSEEPFDGSDMLHEALSEEAGIAERHIDQVHHPVFDIGRSNVTCSTTYDASWDARTAEITFSYVIPFSSVFLEGFELNFDLLEEFEEYINDNVYSGMVDAFTDESGFGDDNYVALRGYTARGGQIIETSEGIRLEFSKQTTIISETDEETMIDEDYCNREIRRMRGSGRRFANEFDRYFNDSDIRDIFDEFVNKDFVILKRESNIERKVAYAQKLKSKLKYFHDVELNDRTMVAATLNMPLGNFEYSGPVYKALSNSTIARDEAASIFRKLLERAASKEVEEPKNQLNLYGDQHLEKNMFLSFLQAAKFRGRYHIADFEHYQSKENINQHSDINFILDIKMKLQQSQRYSEIIAFLKALLLFERHMELLTTKQVDWLNRVFKLIKQQDKERGSHGKSPASISGLASLDSYDPARMTSPEDPED